jgi:fibrillarin-like pre-rRNA processing protein
VITKVEQHRLPGVFTIKTGERSSLATLSLVPGESVYGEKLIKAEDGEFRLWMPRRSKLAASILKGLKEMPIQPGSRVLYLGAASGTTVSHVSDIVGPRGIIYAVEFSPRVARKLLQLSETRTNVFPIVSDARHPTRYSPLVAGPIDVVYQDVAQTDQARILFENLSTFCSDGAWGMIAIKARSIDSTADVRTVYKREISTLNNYDLEIVETVDLEPLEKDHMMVVVRVTG